MKPCPFCAEQIQDAAIKCRFCGSMLVDPPSSAAASVAGAGTAAAATAVATVAAAQSQPAADLQPAVSIHDGPPSWRAQFGAHALTVLLDVVGVALLIVLPWKLNVAFTSALIGAGCCWGVSGVLLLYLVLVRKTLRYRITDRAIEIESGLLSRRIEMTQLWKVKDLEFVQSISDRLLGVASLRIMSRDDTDPILVLWGLPGSRAIYDKLKDAVELARQSRNVLNVIE